ncbi:MAG: CBS domain-containing protein [Anaerolineaceae bacterium]|nr:CBS domain-containing protein [Anaerolineaceae bacterium]
MSERSLVRDLMTVGVASCSPDTLVVDIARQLLEKNLEALIVLNEDGHGVGMVSQDELVKAYSRGDCQQLAAEDVMNDNVPIVPPTIPLTAAAQIMRDQGCRVMFIVHNSDGVTYPAGVLTYQHLLRHLAAEDETDLGDMGIKAARQAPLDIFIARRDAALRRARSNNQE